MLAVEKDIVSELYVYYYISQITWHRADIHSKYRLRRKAWVSYTLYHRTDYNQTLSLQERGRVG
jgi:hypothetical protein